MIPRINTEHPQSYVSRRNIPCLRLLLFTASLSLVACASSPPRVVAQASPPPPPITEVFFYPTQGQSLEQQERDRYECYLWAKNQTGFDPSAPNLAPHQRIKVEPEPSSGHDTAVGAVTGAILGAIVTPRGKATEGAVVGAITGAVIGSASDASRQAQAEEIQQQYDQREVQRRAEIEQQAARYRRALSACLQGRGYTVR